MSVWKITKLLLGAFALLVVAIVAAGGAWVWFDVHKLENFCGSISPGAPLSTLTSLAEAHGINSHFIWPPVADDAHDSWIIYVAAPSTLGDTNCAVHYNQVTQIISSASMVYLP